jgi:hypothetical protein
MHKITRLLTCEVEAAERRPATRCVRSVGGAKRDGVEQARRRWHVLAPRVRGVGASLLLASAASAVNARASDQTRRRRGERRCVLAPRFRGGGGGEGKAGGIGGGFLLCVITFREPTRPTTKDSPLFLSFTSGILAYCLFSFAPFHLHVYMVFLSFTFTFRIFSYSLFSFAPFHLLLR